MRRQQWRKNGKYWRKYWHGSWRKSHSASWRNQWQYGDLRALRDFFQTAMPRLFIILRDRHCRLYLWKVFQNLRKELWSWTRTTTTSCQLQSVLSKRTLFAVPNMELLNGNECTTRVRKCCKKLVNPSMEDITSCVRDGTKTTNTPIPKFFVIHRVDRGANYWTWQDCLGGPFIRRNKTWMNSQNIVYSGWTKTVLNNH